MPSTTKDHYMPAPLSKVDERKLISRWLEYSRDRGMSQKDAVQKMNEKFGTTMRPWQVIRWRKPTTKSDSERTIHIDFVDYMAQEGGIAQIFMVYGVSEDPVLKEKFSTIWYHPNSLVEASVKRVVEERMVEQVKKPASTKDTAKAIVSIYEYVAQNLDLILDGLEIKYSKKALTKKNQRLIAEEIYSIVGFDFSPSR